MHPHPHFSDYHLEQKKMRCIGLLYQSPRSPHPSNKPGLGDAPHSYTSRKGLTGSAWRPAATEAHCSPAGPLPLIQEDPPREPLQKDQVPVVSRLQTGPSGEHRKRKLALRGLGHGCHRRVSGLRGFPRKGVAEPCLPPRGRQPSSRSRRALILRL